MLKTYESKRNIIKGITRYFLVEVAQIQFLYFLMLDRIKLIPRIEKKCDQKKSVGLDVRHQATMPLIERF